MRNKLFTIVAMITVASTALAQMKDLQPGFNLFSAQQDIQVGREAAAQVEREQPIIRNTEVTNYVTGLVQRLARSPHAGKEFPFFVRIVSDKSVNAFALPGGPLFVNTGLIALADNESQLAGVLAHEMSHIRLRHGTNQASKANLVQLPLALLGGVGGDGILGQLAQLGMGVGAGSVLMKMSRSAETQADYNGAQIMAEAGYNPIEMAQLFQKLEAQEGQARPIQFLSDHPNPGNRVKAVQDEINQMPRKAYATDTRQFAQIKNVVARLPAPGQLRSTSNEGQTAPAAPAVRPSTRLKQYQGRAFAFAYPENWQTFGDSQSAMLAVVPSDGVIRDRNGKVSIGYGALVSYYFSDSDELGSRRDGENLSTETAGLIRQLEQSNPRMRVGESRGLRVNGFPALITTLRSNSPYEGETEVDDLVTVVRPQGLWYMILISPESEYREVQPVFERIVQSIRFSN